MKRPWQIASIIFVLVSIFVLIHSFSYPYKDRLGPGPGFFPFWMSIITGLLSLGLFLQTTFAESESGEKKTFFPKRDGAIRIAAVLVSLTFVMVFMNSLGFRLSLLIFLFYYLLLVGVRNIGETGFLSPAVGSWLPVFFLFSACLYLMKRSEKEKSVALFEHLLRVGDHS